MRKQPGFLLPRWLAPALLLGGVAGCRPHATVPPPTPGVPAVVRGLPSKETTTVHKESVGPIRLGMPADAVRKLPNLTVTTPRSQGAGAAGSVLQISQFGVPVAAVQLSNGKVQRVKIVSEKYRTAEGAGIGTPVSRLEKLYGAGQLHTGNHRLCATFARAEGITFCFRPVSPLLSLHDGDWAQLRKLNPGVQWIELSGKQAALSAAAPERKTTAQRE